MSGRKIIKGLEEAIDPPLELQTLFVVLEPQGDMDEADCMAAWHNAANVLGGRVTGGPS